MGLALSCVAVNNSEDGTVEMVKSEFKTFISIMSKLDPSGANFAEFRGINAEERGILKFLSIKLKLLNYYAMHNNLIIQQFISQTLYLSY